MVVALMMTKKGERRERQKMSIVDRKSMIAVRGFQVTVCVVVGFPFRIEREEIWFSEGSRAERETMRVRRRRRGRRGGRRNIKGLEEQQQQPAAEVLIVVYFHFSLFILLPK